MGTSKSGRYLNTKDSGRCVSDFALVHSDEGKYTKPSRKGDRLRRVGNISDHKVRSKAHDTGQSWFPKSWMPKDIRRAGEQVACLKCNRHAPDGKKLYGTYKGVRLVVIKTNGKIATVFPDSIQPTRRNKK